MDKTEIEKLESLRREFGILWQNKIHAHAKSLGMKGSSIWLAEELCWLAFREGRAPKQKACTAARAGAN